MPARQRHWGLTSRFRQGNTPARWRAGGLGPRGPCGLASRSHTWRSIGLPSHPAMRSCWRDARAPRARQSATGASASYAAWLIALEVAFALVYAGVAGVIFWRKSADRVALFVSLTLLFWGLTFPSSMNALAWARPDWFLAVASVRFLGAALITMFFFVFPNGRFAPGWARWLAFVWVVSQIPRYFQPGSFLNPDRWNPWLLLDRQRWIPGRHDALAGIPISLGIERSAGVNAAKQSGSCWASPSPWLVI